MSKANPGQPGPVEPKSESPSKESVAPPRHPCPCTDKGTCVCGGERSCACATRHSKDELDAIRVLGSAADNQRGPPTFREGLEQPRKRGPGNREQGSRYRERGHLSEHENVAVEHSVIVDPLTGDEDRRLRSVADPDAPVQPLGATRVGGLSRHQGRRPIDVRYVVPSRPQHETTDAQPDTPSLSSSTEHMREETRRFVEEMQPDCGHAAEGRRRTDEWAASEDDDLAEL